VRLDEREARRLLGGARVARLATVTPAGQPHIVPVTFAMHGDYLYSAVDAKPKTSRRLRRLANIRANPKVAVLADNYAEDWAALWWVRADGHAEVLDEPGTMAGPIALLQERYPQYREAQPPGPVIAVRVERCTGWAASPPAKHSSGRDRPADG
jgi:PPOX class probable F420-dependent enzyme